MTDAKDKIEAEAVENSVDNDCDQGFDNDIHWHALQISNRNRLLNKITVLIDNLERECRLLREGVNKQFNLWMAQKSSMFETFKELTVRIEALEDRLNNQDG